MEELVELFLTDMKILKKYLLIFYLSLQHGYPGEKLKIVLLWILLKTLELASPLISGYGVNNGLKKCF